MVQKDIIKVGYLVSYDYKYIFTSLKEVYPHADKIVLCYDKNFQTWSGNTFTIPETFFEEIKALDVNNKIQFYKDTFFVEGKEPMELDTRQRQMLGDFMGKGGWHIQIDSDEYPYDFQKFTTFLRSNKYLLKNPKKTPVNILGKWIVLFKEDENGFYVIKPFHETCFVATNNPEYTYSRKTDAYNLIYDFFLIHQSWARSEEEIYTKLTNWSHKNDFDIMTFFENWKNLNDKNYKEFKDFHPLSGSDWEKLEFERATNINEFIEICKQKYPQEKLHIKFSKKIKFFLKSLF